MGLPVADRSDHGLSGSENYFIMTVGQIRRAAKVHKYLLIRRYNGQQFAVNSKIIDIGENVSRPDNRETVFMSFKACNFQEYISKKLPFI